MKTDNIVILYVKTLLLNQDETLRSSKIGGVGSFMIIDRLHLGDAAGSTAGCYMTTQTKPSTNPKDKPDKPSKDEYKPQKFLSCSEKVWNSILVMRKTLSQKTLHHWAELSTNWSILCAN